MYGPPGFLRHDAEAIAGLIASYPLAVLAAVGPEGVVVAHAPLLAERDEQGRITGLSGHVARANPFGRLPDGAACVAVFVGPDAYVSPSAYPSKAAHGRVVPTWNYIRAEVEGRVTFFNDALALEAVVSALTDQMEADRPKPWAYRDAPAAYRALMLDGILGVRIAIDAAAGKWKLSQNRAAEDAAGVMADLGRRAEPRAQAIKRAMETSRSED